MSTVLPDAALLAWWGTAWLRGHVLADHLLDALESTGSVHTARPGPEPVGDLPGTGVLDLLRTLRDAGADHLALALPVDGDPLGLGGPPGFNFAALEAGQAVLAPEAGLGAVPEVVGAGTTWVLRPASRAAVPDVGEADRGLRAAVPETAQALAQLDVARWRPEVADAIMDLHHVPDLDAPPGTPARCVALAARSLQCWAITELAAQDHGAAVTASEMARREAALQPLERAARRGLVAACSPQVWPAG
ncbi:hypothetical protein [Nocardioides campestrisoli]|uniref:hypothetical protein n=1 Tax=Nocardioides campestrisoli TaxID=2736757 RepID=UPI0015E7B6D6|nr:hypothetical protein [Nocardioides campestrisoli]